MKWIRIAWQNWKDLSDKPWYDLHRFPPNSTGAQLMAILYTLFTVICASTFALLIVIIVECYRIIKW